MRGPSFFDRVWRIDLPDREGREAHLARLFRGQIEESCLGRLARETEGFSGAYLKELYLSAAQEAVRRGDPSGAAAVAIRPEHLDTVLPRLKSQMEEAEHYFEPTRRVGFSESDEE